MIVISGISLLYVQKKILQLLEAKDYELRYRSLLTSNSVIHTEGSDEENNYNNTYDPLAEDGEKDDKRTKSSYSKTNHLA
jgi:hypothetical protein